MKVTIPMRFQLLITYTIVVWTCALAGAAPNEHSRDKRIPGSRLEQARRPVPLAKSFARYWATEDVRWLITPEEKKAFLALTNEDERENFIEQFWQRRDPTPDTTENEFKEESYRRIEWANEQFGDQQPGWQTDRGRIYIMEGPPDHIRETPESIVSPPAILWQYTYIDGLGEHVVFKFVDECRCGKFVLGRDPTLSPRPPTPQVLRTRRLSIIAGITTPRPRFLDLEEMAMAHLRKEEIPIHVAFSFERLTNGTAGVRLWIGLEKSHLTRKVGAGGSFYSVRLFGRVTGPRGSIVRQFENRFSNPEQRSDLFDTEDKIVNPQSLSLSPGDHKLFLVVDDSFGNKVGTWEGILPVPDPGKMSASSLVIGDRVGSHRLRTRVLESDFPVQPRFQSDKTSIPCFRPGEELAIWMQLYRLDVNKSASMIAEFRIVNDRTRKVVFEEADRPFVREQVSLSKSIALPGLNPGTYTLEVNIRGPITRTFSKSFRVTFPTGATLGTVEP